jgi:hypothetical protein
MKYVNWKTAGHPIAALSTNLTELLLERACLLTFDALCEAFATGDHCDAATPGEVCEAIALAHVCQQVVPESGAWRVSTKDDFLFTERRVRAGILRS